MSEGTKKTAEHIKKYFQEVVEKSEQASQSIPDKELSEKLKKVKQSSEEVVKHIEKKSSNG